MYFAIQASNPRHEPSAKPDETELRGAIEEAFPMETEDAIMNWNGIRIPLEYKYDLSIMMADVLVLLEQVSASASGSLVIQWPSDTFRSTWRLTWSDDVIRCSATWHGVAGGLETLLRASEDIVLSRGSFLGEWRAPLERTAGGLRAVGYTPGSLAGLDVVERFVSELPPGLLYA